MGRNRYTKSHPLQAKLAREAGLHEKIFLHAEIEALVKLRDWGRAYPRAWDLSRGPCLKKGKESSFSKSKTPLRLIYRRI